MLKKITPWFKSNYGLIITLVFFLAVALFNFTEQGLVNWDEAYFVVVTRTYTGLFKTAVTHPADLFSTRYYRDLIGHYGNIYTAARPSYIIPAAVLGLIVPDKYSTRLLSLLAGLLAVIYFYRLCGLLNLKQHVRLAATFLLAASPLFLSYSRLGLSQLFSAAWLIVAMYYLLEYHHHEKIKNLGKAGLALSILLMSHYNTLIVVGGLFAAGIFFIFQKRKPWKEYLVFALFFLMLPAGYEVVTRAGVAVAAAAGLQGPGGNLPIFSYVQEILEQFNRNGPQPPSSPELMLYYLKLMISPEGLIFFILFLSGLAVFCKKLIKNNFLILLIPVLLHLVFFSLVGIKFTRNLVTILPALYIFPVLALEVVVDFLKPRLIRFRALTAAIFITFFPAVFLVNCIQYSSLLTIRTHFREVAAYITNNFPKDDTLIFSASAPFWRVYLPEYRSEMTRKIPDGCRDNSGKNIVFIADYFHTIYEHEDSALLDACSKRPLREWSTNIFSARAIVLDFIFQSEADNEAMFAANTPSSPVTVYALSPPAE